MATKGIWIPVEILRDHSLTMQEKLILMEIHQLTELDNNQCYASNEHFSKMLDISKKSVSNTISNLVKKGRIGVELSDRNHKRLLSIKDGHLSIKDGHLSIKDGESKDNKTINKTINTKKQEEEQEEEQVIDNKARLIKIEAMASGSKGRVSKFEEMEFKELANKIDNAKDMLDEFKDQANKKFGKKIIPFMMDYLAQAKEGKTKKVNYATC